MDGSEWFLIAFFALLGLGWAIYFVTTAWFEHRERMAKIEKGIDPDEPFPGALPQKDTSK